MSVARLVVSVLLGILLTASSAVAQPLGTFRWQLHPHCNIISVNVIQQGGIYTLDGTDDRCGAAQTASVVGLAFLNPDGTVGFGLTVVLPGGTPVHIEAAISLASLNGTWRDSAGNSGNFIFTPGPGIGGSQRPVPSGGIAPNSITAIQIAPAAVGASQLAADAVTGANIVNGSIATADLLAPPRAAFVGGGIDATDLALIAKLIRQVPITAATAGTVIANATGFFQFNSPATVDYGACSLSTTGGEDTNFTTFAAEQTVDAMFLVPFALTRAITVAPGVTTFSLICRLNTGNVSVHRTSLNLLFVPQ